MASSLNFKKFIVLNLILLVFLLAGGISEHLRITAGIIFFAINGFAIGKTFFKHNALVLQLAFGCLFLSAASALFGTAVFYLSGIHSYHWQAWLIIISIALPLLSFKKPLIIEWKFYKLNFNLPTIVLTSLFIFLQFLAYLLIWQSRTAQAIRTPWEVLPDNFLAIYFVLFLVLLLIIRNSKGNWPLILIVSQVFLTFSLATIIYEIGFGFDPFIHRANVKLINETGVLLPKPLYYIGQYGLILFYNFLFKIPIATIDKFLVPVLSAVFLPLGIFTAFLNNFKTKRHLLLTVTAGLMLIPFFSFIATTPQALANLIALITILLAIFSINNKRWIFWPISIMALFTLSIHPISGLPLLFFVILLAGNHYFFECRMPSLLKNSIAWELVILGGLALPIAFLINSTGTLSELKVAWHSGWLLGLKDIFKGLIPFFYYRRYISAPDLWYTYCFNIFWLISSLAIAGLAFTARRRQFKKYSIFLLGALIALINYLLVKSAVNFLSLISYEQQNYPQRIMEIGLYFLAPLAIIGLYLTIEKIYKIGIWAQISMIMLLALCSTAAFYYDYPRVDKIKESHGYSTSITDVKTVKFIDNLEMVKNKSADSYAVLASQPVSAAAIQEFSFRTYHNGLYFYPVPTGGKLYQLYEEYAYGRRPSQEIAATARYLTGAKKIYFVINNYWFSAIKRIEQEKETANAWYALDGKNYIFLY